MGRRRYENSLVAVGRSRHDPVRVTQRVVNLICLASTGHDFLVVSVLTSLSRGLLLYTLLPRYVLFVSFLQLSEFPNARFLGRSPGSAPRPSFFPASSLFHPDRVSVSCQTRSPSPPFPNASTVPPGELRRVPG
jgi:hypothetical protein